MYAFLCIWFCMASRLDAAPIERQMVDLTYVFKENATTFPLLKQFEITVIENGTQPPGYWEKSEDYSSSTHAGTHMDAPSHSTPGGINIDKLPMEHFIGPAAVIDITERALVDPDAGVTVDDLENWECITGQSLNGKIVLMRSGYGRFFYNRTAYLGTSGNDLTQLHFPGIEPDAAEWLVNNRNIYGVGVDTVSLDKGINIDSRSHAVLLGSGCIYGLENMANLEALPIVGATLYVLPMKLEASAAPTRILATFPKYMDNYKCKFCLRRS